MVEKIKVWMCDNCLSNEAYQDVACFSFVQSNCKRELPDCDLDSNWKPTEDFEIVEKKGNVPDKPTPPPETPKSDFSNKLNIGMTKKEAENHKTPNCAVCRWFDRCDDIKKYSHCRAQGEALARDVYNSEQCQALFEPVESLSVLSDKEREKTFVHRASIYLSDCTEQNVLPKYTVPDHLKKALNETECKALAEIHPYPLDEIKDIFWSGK